MLGVIEIASFNKFEKHEIEFVEKVAQSIASTLKSVRINIRTSQLLEQSQQQSEEMAAQEEEMRQNMEELQATQEESARREAEFKGTLDAIDHFLLKAEFNFNGDLLHANNQFLFKFDYSINEIKGLKHTAFIPEKDSKKFQEIWRSVISGSEYQEKMNLKLKSGRSLPFIISINPVYIDDEIDKIILMAVDLAMFTN
jgi:PAS domain S-box-containing protein